MLEPGVGVYIVTTIISWIPTNPSLALQSYRPETGLNTCRLRSGFGIGQVDVTDDRLRLLELKPNGVILSAEHRADVTWSRAQRPARSVETTGGESSLLA